MASGWIKLHRQLQECPIWYGERFSKGQAWVDLLMLANHSDKEILFNGEITTIKRGQYLTSMVKLSEKWLWNRKTVLSFLRLLEKDNMISRVSDNKKTLITIENYEIYQSKEVVDGQQNGQLIGQQTTQQNGQQLDSRTDANKNNKNEEESNNKDIARKKDARELFELLWKLYPVKKGKGHVSDTAKLRLLKIGYEELSRAIERYLKELEKDADWRKPQNGSTFFNSGYIDYLDENYAPGKNGNTDKKNKFNNFNQREYDYDELEKIFLNN